MGAALFTKNGEGRNLRTRQLSYFGQTMRKVGIEGLVIQGETEKEGQSGRQRLEQPCVGCEVQCGGIVT